MLAAEPGPVPRLAGMSSHRSLPRGCQLPLLSREQQPWCWWARRWAWPRGSRHPAFAISGSRQLRAADSDPRSPPPSPAGAPEQPGCLLVSQPSLSCASRTKTQARAFPESPRQTWHDNLPAPAGPWHPGRASPRTAAEGTPRHRWPRPAARQPRPGDIRSLAGTGRQRTARGAGLTLSWVHKPPMLERLQPLAG